jgi:diguanylate cyclase (GGDEF)-like protein/PAS domain S-box-containing protein
MPSAASGAVGAAAVTAAIARESRDGFMLIGPEGTVVSHNRRFTEIWGVPAATLNPAAIPLLQSVASLTADPKAFLARVAEFHELADEKSTEELKLNDGRTLEFYCVPAHLDDGSYLGRVWFFRDITAHRLADEKILEDASQFRALVEQQVAGIFIITGDGNLAYINPRFAALFGYTPPEVLGKPFLDLIVETDRTRLQQFFLEHLQGGPPATQSITAIKRKGGGIMNVLAHASLSSFKGRPALVGLVVDITEEKRAMELLRASEERFRAVCETAQDAIIMVDSHMHVVFWNCAAERILGYTAAEAIGRSPHDWLAPQRFQKQAAAGLSTFAATGRGKFVGSTVELAALRKDGVEIPVELSTNSVLLGEQWHAVAVLRDLTEGKLIEDRIAHMTRYDSLTGLANRASFVAALQEQIAAVQRGGKRFALLHLGLDHFKDVNNTLGHPIGDLLLQSLADRLRRSIRPTDILARFGGDEFALIEPGAVEPEIAAALAGNLLKAIDEPFSIQGNEVRSAVSIGIALYGPDSPDAETLLSHADVALYRAKQDGRSTVRFFTDAMELEVQTRVTLAAEIRDGLTAGEFFLVFQPQVDADTGRIVGVEALARWNHSGGKIVMPGVFIPAAERSGSIVALGQWALLEACRQMKRWLDAGIAPPQIAVNVSGAQFKNPHELEKNLAAILEATGVPPQRVELELTETVLMRVSREHADALVRLRQAGHRIAIDDFGSGYSSLEYLGRFPVDLVKIGQTFILDLANAPRNSTIAKAAVGLAHDLHLDVVVEGVETPAQLKEVRSWGCRKVQGFYFSKPLSAETLSTLLRARATFPVSPRPAAAAN